MVDTLATAERVRAIISNHLGVTGFAWDALLIPDLGADSLDKIELQIALEEEFDTVIADDLVSGWASAGDVLATFTEAA